ncbi:MAG: type II toxin-antitoxin system PemK/MazF family toxin [Parcubacteria group bacterium]|nr:type II toxin-antitoxin system PemK/MazF family toxin [Parcubacteria group bacterium]
MVKNYIPERGDIIWLTFGRTKGHEQSGRRPALVLSTSGYQKASGLAVVCPITSVIKPYPFRVEFRGEQVYGAIIADQVQSVAWQERRPEYIESASDAVRLEVIKIIVTLIGVTPF